MIIGAVPAGRRCETAWKQGTPRASGVVCSCYGALWVSLCLLSHIIAQLHSPLARFTLPPQAKSLSRGFVIRAIGEPAPPSCRTRDSLSSHQINLPPVSSVPVPVTIAVAVTITLPSCTRPNGALQEAVATCNLQGPRPGAS